MSPVFVRATEAKQRCTAAEDDLFFSENFNSELTWKIESSFLFRDFSQRVKSLLLNSLDIPVGVVGQTHIYHIESLPSNTR